MTRSIVGAGTRWTRRTTGRRGRSWLRRERGGRRLRCAGAEPWRAVRRGGAGMAAGGGAVVWRSGRADRGDAPDHRRRAALDRRGAVPARAVVLHAAAGSGSAAVGDLYRLADARHAGRDHGGRVVR